MTPAEVDEDDKRSYMDAWRGSTPWQKRYSLLGGAASITFRSLLPSEYDIVAVQLRLHQREGRSQVELAELDTRYCLSLSIRRVEMGGRAFVAPENYTGWNQIHPGGPRDNVSETSLPLIYESLLQQVFTSEERFRSVIIAYSDFRSKLARLEANALNADFWQPTESRS